MSLRQFLIVAGIAGVSAIAGFWVNQQRSMPAPDAVASTGAYPQGSIKDLDGREHTLSEWSGKILVVNFWATWCPPCVKEIPAFVELQTRFGDRGLQFVGIALDDPVEAGKFATARGVNYPMLAGDQEVAALMQSLGNTIGALPYTVVFDGSGKIVHTQQGEWSPPSAVEVLTPLLAPASMQQIAR
jgi:thiol-disulfide isomerase/thioredoxin